MPYPKTIALLRNGEVAWYSKGKMEFESMESILNHNFDGFCKEVTGEMGAGAFTISVLNGSVMMMGKESTIEDLRIRIGDKSYIIQDRVENHHVLKNIYPYSLNTIRLVTAMCQDGHVEFYGAQIRFGSGGSIVDNAGQGGFFVGINGKGVISDVGYFEPLKRNYISVYCKHPDTHVDFVGVTIPYWNKIIETAINFHKFYYGIPSMGWDIAVTEDGFVFTEAGEDWEIPLNQCTDGGQRKHFYRIFGYALDMPLRKFK